MSDIAGLDPYNSLNKEVVEAIMSSDDPRSELDEHFMSTEVQQFRWAHGRSSCTKKDARIRALVIEAKWAYERNPDKYQRDEV